MKLVIVQTSQTPFGIKTRPVAVFDGTKKQAAEWCSKKNAAAKDDYSWESVKTVKPAAE